MSNSLSPIDCSPPGSTVHWIFQARIRVWVAIFYSRGSSQPRDWTHISYVSSIGRQILYHCAIWEALRFSRVKAKIAPKLNRQEKLNSLKQKLGEILRAAGGMILSHLCLITGFSERKSILSCIFMAASSFTTWSKMLTEFKFQPSQRNWDRGAVLFHVSISKDGS